jgi:hypothetical protein
MIGSGGQDRRWFGADKRPQKYVPMELKDIIGAKSHHRAMC